MELLVKLSLTRVFDSVNIRIMQRPGTEAIRTFSFRLLSAFSKYCLV